MDQRLGLPAMTQNNGVDVVRCTFPSVRYQQPNNTNGLTSSSRGPTASISNSTMLPETVNINVNAQQPMMSSNMSAVNQNFVPQIEFSCNIDVTTTKDQNKPVCKWMIEKIRSLLDESELEQSHPCNRSFSTIGKLIDHLDYDHIKESHHRICKWENCTADKTHNFQYKGHLLRHLKTKASLRFRCEYEECRGITYNRKDNIENHIQQKHRN